MLKGKVRTTHPVYYVRSLAESLRFYHDQLGFAIGFEIEEAKVALIELTAGAALVLGEDAAKVASAGAPVFVLNIDDVDAAYAALGSRGVKFTAPPSDEFYGRAVELRDPDGYRLCLVS